MIDAADRPPGELLADWHTLPMIADAVAATGAEVHVLQSSRTHHAFERDGVSYRFVSELRLRPGTGPGIMPWRLAAEIRAIRPDVVHFHGFEAPLHLQAISSGPAPVLVQDHASMARPREKWVRRWSVSRAAGYAFTSVAQARPLLAGGHLRADAPVFEIIESSTSFTPGDRGAARAATGVFGNPALLWIGHLDGNKDPLTILRAVGQVLPLLPNLQLWCAYGRGDLLPEVERLLASDPALRGHVHLLGRVSHSTVEALCRACDLFVSGSHREGSGYALIEALACGLLPVVSDIPPFRAITADGKVGCLAPPGDAERFAAAIVAQAGHLGPAARAQVLAHFDACLSPSALGRQLSEVYYALLAHRRCR